MLRRDEEGGDGGDAVLEFLEGVYTVSKAVFNGDVGSRQVSCEVHGEAFDGLVHHAVAGATMGGSEAAALLYPCSLSLSFPLDFGGLFQMNLEAAHTKAGS